MSDPILPLAVWAPGTNQNSIPANDNALRLEILNGDVISDSTTAQPGSPSSGDIYIIPAAATGAQWATFDQYDLTIYKSGTWYAYAPVEGIVVNVAGVLKRWTGSAYTVALTLTALGVSSYAQTLLDDTDEAGARDTLKIGPRYCFEAIADFATSSSLGSSAAVGPEWAVAASGTGAQVVTLAGLTSGNSAGRQQIALGTTTTGRAAFTSSLTTHALGSGAVQFVLKGAMESLSDGTDTFVQRMGLMDSVSAEPTNGCYFRYTHSVNSGKWECVTRAAGVETATDSGVTAVAGTERVWQVRVNAAGTSVDFVIDGVTVQTHVTNIPTARLGFMAAAIRSAGTVAKSAIGMDLIYARIDFTTPRW